MKFFWDSLFVPFRLPYFLTDAKVKFLYLVGLTLTYEEKTRHTFRRRNESGKRYPHVSRYGRIVGRI